MKIRTGYVSNSSSSSFCIAKCYMNEEQIQQFREYLNSPERDSSETYIGEDEFYFLGEVSMHEDPSPE